jgi:hypothetical protein
MNSIGIDDQTVWTQLVLEATGASETIESVVDLFDSPAETEEQRVLQVGMMFVVECLECCS